MIYRVGQDVEAVAAALRDARANGNDMSDADMVRLWREKVPAPVEQRPDR
jgi:hypothetical protein